MTRYAAEYDLADKMVERFASLGFGRAVWSDEPKLTGITRGPYRSGAYSRDGQWLVGGIKRWHL